MVSVVPPCTRAGSILHSLLAHGCFQLFLVCTVDGTIARQGHSNDIVGAGALCSRRYHTYSFASFWQRRRIQTLRYSRLAGFVGILVLLIVELPVFILLTPDVATLLIVITIIFKFLLLLLLFFSFLLLFLIWSLITSSSRLGCLGLGCRLSVACH